MAEAPKFGIVVANSDDPFDSSRLLVSQDFLEATPVKKLLTTIPVRKPGPQDFVRVQANPQYRGLLAFVELKEDREIYAIDLQSVPELHAEGFIAPCSRR
jgi:hypothetical protein